jgi:hypothetical protein
MPIMRPVQEPILGFGVSGAGVQDAVGAAAPMVQASQNLEQRGINAQKAQEAANYQKLLRSGADGMRAYATEVAGIHPELGQQLAQEAEQYATFFNDPNLTGDKAEQYASHFYESANNRIKYADEQSGKAKEAQAKAEAKAKADQAFAAWDATSKAEQEKLGFNLKDTDINRIASSASPEVQAHESYQKAVDNLKKKTPVNETGTVRRDALNDKQEEDALRRAIAFKEKNASAIGAGTRLKKIDSILTRMGVEGGIHGDPKGSIEGAGIGAKTFKKWLQGKDAVEFRNTLQWLHNGIRNQLFGASLTEGEMAAFEQAAGTGNLSNERDLITGLQNIYAELDQNLRPIGDQRTKDIIKAEGIFTRDDLPHPKKAKGVTLGKGQKKDFGGGISVERMD